MFIISSSHTYTQRHRHTDTDTHTHIHTCIYYLYLKSLLKCLNSTGQQECFCVTDSFTVIYRSSDAFLCFFTSIIGDHLFLSSCKAQLAGDVEYTNYIPVKG